MKTNPMYIVSLLNEKVKQVEVSFFTNKYDEWKACAETYEYFTMLPVHEGDIVLVEARSNYGVGQVRKVLEEPTIEENSDAKYRWVVHIFPDNQDPVGKSVALAEYEAEVGKKYQTIKRKAQRNALKRSLREELGEDLVLQLETMSPKESIK